MIFIVTEDHVDVESEKHILYFLSKFSNRRYERNISKKRLDKM